MMLGTVAGTFIYNGQPQNGAIARLWLITAFASYVDSTDTVQDNPLSAASIELTVLNGALFTEGDILRIETEYLKVWLISTNLLYVIRGWHGSIPASHVVTTPIYIETITEPQMDDAEPAPAYQQGGDVTTGVTYGGYGAYRFDDVPEGEYYVSVGYDAHIAWLYAAIERDDPTASQLLTTRGDLLIRGVDDVKRLAKGTSGHVLTQGANEAAWAAFSGCAINFTETEVFNGASPIAPTDLDLSATIGANSAIVKIKATQSSGSNVNINVRTNGDTGDYQNNSAAFGAGCACALIMSGKSVMLLVKSDPNGIIEWQTSQSETFILRVMDFWK